MAIQYSEVSRVRIARITPPSVAPPSITVLLPTPDGRPLLVEELRTIARPETYGPWKTLDEWHRWVETFAERGHRLRAC